MNESRFDWRRFLALTAAGIVGVLAVVPYRLAAVKIPEVRPGDVLVQAVVVNGPLVAVAVAVGTALAPRVGLRVRAADADARDYAIAAAAGLGVAAGIVALDLAVLRGHVSVPLLGDAPTEAMAPFWPRALAGLHGGVTEELLLRYGLLTSLLWFGASLADTLDRPTTDASAWAAILLVALGFGATQLPTTAAPVAITPGVLALALALNGLPGVLFGWLYWRRDLLAAMVAHLAADAVLVVLAPLLF